MANVTLNVLKCNFHVAKNKDTNKLEVKEIEQLKIKQIADTTVGYVDIYATNYTNYTPMSGYEVNRYNFTDDLEGNYHKEEKVIAFFYIQNTDISTLTNRDSSFLSLTYNNANTSNLIADNLISNVKKVSCKTYLKEKEMEVKTNYRVNPYKVPSKGEDPFDMKITYIDENGDEITTDLLPIEQQKVYARFNLEYKQVVNQYNIEFLDIKKSEDLLFVNFDRDAFKVGNYLRIKNLFFPNAIDASYGISAKIVESKVENINGVTKRNIVAEQESSYYVLKSADFVDNNFVLNRNCYNVNITEKINEDTKEIERNLIFDTKIEDLKDCIFPNRTFPFPGDYIYIANPDIVDSKALKQQINSISWEVNPNVKEIKFNLDEQLLNYSRQLKRNVINVAKAKDKENLKKNEDYNRKKVESISAQANKEIKDVKAEYYRVIKEKREQVRKDERAILQLANYIEKTLNNINTVNNIIVKNHNTLIAKVDKDMPLVAPDAFRVDPSYPDLAPPDNLTDDQLQDYIQRICGGSYTNPWKNKIN